MLDDELRELLAVDPPPALAARVRARIDATVPAVPWWGPPAVAVGVTAAVVAAVGATWLISGEPVPERHRHAVPTRSDLSGIALRTQVPITLAPVVVSASPVRAVISRRQHQAVAQRSGPSALPTALLIDRAETRALQQLFTSGPVDVGSSLSWAAEIVIAPLTIEPLTPQMSSDEELPLDAQGQLPPGDHR